MVLVYISLVYISWYCSLGNTISFFQERASKLKLQWLKLFGDENVHLPKQQVKWLKLVSEKRGSTFSLE